MSYLINPHRFAATGGGTIANASFFDTRDARYLIALSGSNLIATKTFGDVVGYAYVFGRHGKITGKHRFQVTLNSISGSGDPVEIGIANPMFLNQASNLGSDNFGAGLNNVDGLIRTGGSSASGATFAAGDVIDVYVDLTSNLLWFAKNGTAVAGVVGVSGGTSLASFGKAAYPAVDLFNAPSAATLNCGATAFTYASLDASFAGWSDAEDYSRVFHRRVGIRILSAGFFAQAMAEMMIRDTSGGSSTASGGTAIGEGAIGGALANLFDGNSTTYWAHTNNVGANQLPSWCGYDFGADGARSTQYVALQSRDGGGGAEAQAPTAFYLIVGGASNWFKDNYHTCAAWPGTTPGAIREFAFS